MYSKCGKTTERNPKLEQITAVFFAAMNWDSNTFNDEDRFEHEKENGMETHSAHYACVEEESS